MRHESEGCYVYVIGEEHTNYVKVGYSDDPEARRKKLQTGNPRELVLRWKYPVSGGRRHEEALHKYLVEFHVRDEWYLFSNDMLKILSMFTLLQELAVEPENDWLFDDLKDL